MKNLIYDEANNTLSINGYTLQQSEDGEFTANESNLIGLGVTQLPEDVKIWTKFLDEADSRLKVVAIENLNGELALVQMAYRVCSSCWREPGTARDHVIAAWVYMAFLEISSTPFSLSDLFYWETEYVILFDYKHPLRKEPVEELVKRAKSTFDPVRRFLRERAIVEDSWGIGGTELEEMEKLQSNPQGEVRSAPDREEDPNTNTN